MTGRVPIEERDLPGRRVWTLTELAQVRERFGAEDVPDVLALLGPNEWISYYEDFPPSAAVNDLAVFRRRAARWRAAEEMGFTPAEAALAGATAKAIAAETEGAA